MNQPPPSKENSSPPARSSAHGLELLAPAGGLEAGWAAFQYGADAVYLGLQRYSARADAQNFTFEELSALIGWARSLSPVRRVFVALNTLALQAELDGLISTLGTLADLRPDALIVQDLGVARVVRRYFPELTLHASTQLAAHSRAAVETLRDLGFARVTLARELTLDEIRQAASVPGMEVETFLHGALCYAYSGLCLFSSHVLGRSGNRGQCAYPCRDRWEVTRFDDAPPEAALSPAQRSGFAFSMKDLALPDYVAALREAGVASLKIEGRKKSPLYVATTVDYYRHLLDGALPASERAEREADLKAVFARPWTSLYLRSNRDKDVADRDIVGHRGAPIGTLQAVVKSGPTACLRFRTTRALARHDGLQIDVPGLDRPFGFGVSSLRVLEGRRGAEAWEAPAGAVVEIPLPDDYPQLPIGAALYCSSSQEVKQRYRLDKPNASAHRLRKGVRIEAEVAEGALRLSAEAEGAPGKTVRVEQAVAGAFDAARDAAKMETTARTAFDKLGDTRFQLAAFTWRNPLGRFVPVSQLNDARRTLAEALDQALIAQRTERITAAQAALAPECTASPADTPLRWTVKVDRLATLDAFQPEDFTDLDEVVLDLRREPLPELTERLDALGQRLGGREKLRLALPLIVRGWDERGIRAKVEALRGAGFTRWELTNVASWSLLGVTIGDTAGLDLAADWSLYVTNRAAARQLRDMGLRRVTLSPEDVATNLTSLLGELGTAASVVVFEDSPLFISESCPYANLKGGCVGPSGCTFSTMEMTSSHGSKVLVVNERCRSVTVNAEPFNLSPQLGRLREAGARSLRAHFLYRPYEPERARALWRALRDLQVVKPGHPGNFERAEW